MTIELTSKETLAIRRLGNALDTGMVPVTELRKFLDGIQRKIVAPAGPEGKRTVKKIDRKTIYRSKLKIA